jgi:hypothetical protein
MIVVKSNCNISANKSNHPIQNKLLLLVTEPQTRDSIKDVEKCKLLKSGIVSLSVPSGLIRDYKFYF